MLDQLCLELTGQRIRINDNWELKVNSIDEKNCSLYFRGNLVAELTSPSDRIRECILNGRIIWPKDITPKLIYYLVMGNELPKKKETI